MIRLPLVILNPKDVCFGKKNISLVLFLGNHDEPGRNVHNVDLKEIAWKALFG